MTQPMLRHRAYDRFKARLFARDLKPGQFVSQRELSELMDVPVGPLREALKKLEAEALVRLIPQRGIQIAAFDADFLNDAFGLRRVLELAAARKFAADGPMAAIDDLEARTEKVHRRVKSNPSREAMDEALRLDWRMHDAIVENMGNALLTEVHRINFDKIRLARLHRRFTRERVLPALEEHLAVIAAFKARDPDKAEAALGAHLSVAHRRAVGIDP
jgi:DNA-binding GntR family transcriptional regulator